MTTSMEPTENARKEMMKAARSKKNPDNSFFISKETGEIVSRAYRDRNSYFGSIPEGTYEVHIETVNPFFSYDDLNDWINQVMQRVWEEDRMQEEGDRSFLESVSNIPDTEIEERFGLNPVKLAEIRARVA